MNELSKRHWKLSLISTLNIAFFILITEHVFYESIFILFKLMYLHVFT